MKKFSIKLIGFMGIMACLIAGLNYLLAPDLAKREKTRVKRVLARAESVTSVCLGRSHAAALDYDALGISGENMAMGGRDLASIEFWLRTMAPKLPELKTVFISISYSSLYFDNKSLSPGGSDARVALYYSLPTWRFMSGDRSDFLLAKIFSFISPDHGRSLVTSRTVVGDALSANRWAETYTTEEELDVSAKHQAYVHSIDRQIAIRNNATLIEESIDTLSRIQQFLSEKGIQCIFFTPPYHKLYTDYFPAEHLEEMRTTMQKVQEGSGACYYDLSFVDGISTDARSYHNADHLNREGKVKFSEVFSAHLKQNGVWSAVYQIK